MFCIIGNKKTATILLVLTDGFNCFESAKELCSYIGLTPTIGLWRKEKVKNDINCCV